MSSRLSMTDGQAHKLDTRDASTGPAFGSALARVIADAYEIFERRVAAESEVSGSKQNRVRDYILRQSPSEFRKRDVERALPGVSPASIRLVLNELRDARQIVLEGSGPGARWHRTATRS